MCSFHYPASLQTLISVPKVFVNWHRFHNSCIRQVKEHFATLNMSNYSKIYVGLDVTRLKHDTVFLHRNLMDIKQNCELFLVKVVKSFIKLSKAHFSLFEYFDVKFCYSLIYVFILKDYHGEDSCANNPEMNF